jgi:hypothetical protein
MNLQVGALTDRLEFGMDYDASDETAEPWLFNAKVIALSNEPETSQLALGFRNLGDEEKPEGYAVTTWTRDMLRGHVGATVSEERHTGCHRRSGLRMESRLVGLCRMDERQGERRGFRSQYPAAGSLRSDDRHGGAQHVCRGCWLHASSGLWRPVARFWQ